MGINCKYHPTQQAHFECSRCQTSYCPHCVSKREAQKLGMTKKEKFYFCPKCNFPATPLEVGTIVTPFWKRLPLFFTYPFKKQPLFFIVALALIGIVFPNSMIINFFLWAALIKYSYAVLINTSLGNQEPPKFSLELITDKFSQVFKQILFFGIIGASLFFVFGFWGPLGGILFLILIVIFAPALMMLLVTNDSIVSALNPKNYIALVGKIGGRYFQMHLFLLLLSGAPMVLASLAQYFLAGFILKFVYQLAENYYTILTYNLMGYVLLQYHEQIGYDVDYCDFKEQTALKQKIEENPYENLINEVNIYVVEGRIDEAVKLIAEETQGKITDENLSRKYYNLLKEGKRPAELVTHGKNYLELLNKGSNKIEACKIYKECLSHDPLFEPNNQTLYKIAGWLIQLGENKHGVNAFIRFIKSNPKHDLIPDAYYQVAKTLHEKLNNTSKAKELLKGLQRNFPQHELALDAHSYLKQISS